MKVSIIMGPDITDEYMEITSFEEGVTTWWFEVNTNYLQCIYFGDHTCSSARPPA